GAHKILASAKVDDSNTFANELARASIPERAGRKGLTPSLTCALALLRDRQRALVRDCVAGLEVERVQEARVDGQRRPLALARGGAAPDLCDEGAAVVVGLRVDRLDGLVADELPELLGRDRRRVDGEVKEYLGAHVLADVDADVEAGVVRAGLVGDVLGPDAESDAAARIAVQRRPLGDEF